ncbi:MAG: zinc ribbon domain-containing protein [Porticoccaceae bacterium]|nr:zinc ribbon domain-containing protein [Porticoccaceae bacterium]
MPIYEYLCQSCGHELEVIQKVADPRLTECPACGKPELNKQLTASAFRLSGSGWYETDFKTGDKKRNLVGDDGSGGSTAASAKAESTGSKSEKSSSSDVKPKPASDAASATGAK